MFTIPVRQRHLKKSNHVRRNHDVTNLVTGGTGTLGRLVVRRLRDAGYDDLRVLSRRHYEAADGIEFITGDLATGEGIEPALDGAGTIVHCAGSAKGDEYKARNLVRAASRAGAA